jgi:hypothetical protein
MSSVSVTAAPVGDRHHLSDRLAARALRLALDPCAKVRDGATELALLAGDSPRHLAAARRRLRCGDKRGRSRIVAHAEQLLIVAQWSAELRIDQLPGPHGAVVTSIWAPPRRREEA